MDRWMKARRRWAVAVCLLAAVCMVVCPSVLAISAEEYLEWYRKQQAAAAEAVPVEADTVEWQTGRYSVTGVVTIESPVQVTGDVHLELGEGAELTVNGGIQLGADGKLTVSGTGRLKALASEDGRAGIGLTEKGFDQVIAIEGGYVKARGGKGAPGIGGCRVAISGGTVCAYGGEGAAGISSGRSILQITDGFVFAKGGGSAPGISGESFMQEAPEASLVIMAESGDGKSAAIDVTNMSSGSSEPFSGLIFQNGVGVPPSGSYCLNRNLVIPKDYQLVLQSYDRFTIAGGVTLHNYGNIRCELKLEKSAEIGGQGTLVNEGTIGENISIHVGSLEIPLHGLALQKHQIEIKVGETVTLKVMPTPSNAIFEPQWVSSNGTIASAEPGGIIKGLRAGTVTVTASVEGMQDSCTVTVIDPSVPAQSVSIQPETLSMEIGETAELTAQIVPADATDTPAWASDNPAVAMVDKNGKVTALAEGQAVVSVTAGEYSASCVVTVSKPAGLAVSIILDQTQLLLTEGESVALHATVVPEDAADQEVQWTSNFPQVVSVEDGVVTAKIPNQSAVITASIGEVSATCKVRTAKKVLPPPEESEELEDPPDPSPEEPDESGDIDAEDGTESVPVTEREEDKGWTSAPPMYIPSSPLPSRTVSDGWHGAVYYLDGARAEGWQEIGGENYYFIRGRLQTGWIETENGWYYAGEDGEQHQGWLKIGNAWYYLDPDSGQMLDSGLVQLGGVTYYFYDWGGMACDWWYEAEDGWYFFDGSGAMRKNAWVFWKGKWYYLGEEGRMAVGTVTPDGYRVDENGVWVG